MFTPDSGKADKPALIPDKTLAFAQVRFQELKRSQRTNGEYAKLEFIITEGPFEGRRVYSIVMNPLDPANKNEALRADNKPDGAKMGLTALTRMFEACRMFDHTNPKSYAKFDNMAFQDVIGHLDGNTVAIQIKIKPGTDGYEDRNEVASYLSPNPESGTTKLWAQLTGGAPAVAQARTNAFSQPSAPAPTRQSTGTPGWMKGPNNPF
jgi:hypothetical protein